MSTELATALTNPFWAALRGPLAGLAVGDDLAVRFDPAVNIFGALPDEVSGVSWKALAQLIGARSVVLSRAQLDLPPDWTVGAVWPGVQLVAPAGCGRVWPEIVPLGAADAPEMLALAQRAAPGPFLLRTLEQGGFVGVREGARLVAMGGLRCQFSGGAEISTVCVTDEARGRGLGSRVVQHLVEGIERRGDVAFLHTAADNAPAIALYDKLGFVLRARPDFVTVTAPAKRAS